jgi:hypothetical protein
MRSFSTRISTTANHLQCEQVVGSCECVVDNRIHSSLVMFHVDKSILRVTYPQWYVDNFSGSSRVVLVNMGLSTVSTVLFILSF